jgi:hypothetical protein
VKDHASIFLINKDAFLKIVKNHLADFRNILGDHITPSLLLQEIQKTRNIYKTLKHSNLLLGILFGYGRHNAELFQKKYNFIKRFPTKRKECPYKLSLVNNTKLPLSPPRVLDLPRFAADPDHPETKQLKEKYKKQSRQIHQILESGDFLEVVLTKFAE